MSKIVEGFKKQAVSLKGYTETLRRGMHKTEHGPMLKVVWNAFKDLGRHIHKTSFHPGMHLPADTRKAQKSLDRAEFRMNALKSLGFIDE